MPNFHNVFSWGEHSPLVTRFGEPPFNIRFFLKLRRHVEVINVNHAVAFQKGTRNAIDQSQFLDHLKLTCYLGNSAAKAVLAALASKLSWSPPPRQDLVAQLRLPLTPLQHRRQSQQAQKQLHAVQAQTG